MSHLIAIDYPDVATATTVRDRLLEMQKEKLITLEDVAVVERRQDGKIKLHQMTSTTGIGAAGGALWGGLIGLLFFMPLLGMALGAGAGALGGAMTDVGVDDKFMKDLGSKLEPGTAALFMLVVKSTPDKVIPQIAQYGGRIIQTSLGTEEEAQLRTAAKAAMGRR
ncbi:DUF1269 domain-containing protein [Streptosporangium sp. NPDC087985]|uniref:DUF1269 domain-containing protein n=1 Tax=Streptosporangium sp. NPDC087985 TaxID=3366196 RepID=UPI00382C5E3B